jgi:hypothetical protein
MSHAPTALTRNLVVLGALAIGVFLLLVVPSMASAATTAPAADQTEQESTAPDQATAPVTEEQAPADETATTTPGDEAQPPADQTVAPPPASTTPEPAPAPAPAPTGDPQPTAPPSSGTTPAPAPSSGEAAPESSTTVVLPAVPSLPASMKAVAMAQPTAGPPPAPLAPVITPVAPPTAPPDAPSGAQGLSASGAAKTDARPPPTSHLVEALGGLDRAITDTLAPSREIGHGPAGEAGARDEGGNPFDTIAAPGGPAPAGSSLLAVLASYVLPGTGIPATTLLLFVQLAVILAVGLATRSGIRERIHALGLNGPRHGYRTVLARPG